MYPAGQEVVGKLYPAAQHLADNNHQKIANYPAGLSLASQLLLESAYLESQEAVVKLSRVARHLADSNYQKIANYPEGLSLASQLLLESLYQAGQEPVGKLSPVDRDPLENNCQEIVLSVYPAAREPVVKLSPAGRDLADNNCRMIVNCQADRHPADRERMVNLSLAAQHLVDSNCQKIVNYPEGLSLASQLLLESVYPEGREPVGKLSPAVREPASKLLVGNVCLEGLSLASQLLLGSACPADHHLAENNYQKIANYPEGLSLASQLLLESACPAGRHPADRERMVKLSQASRGLVDNNYPEGLSLASQLLLESVSPADRDRLESNYQAIVLSVYPAAREPVVKLSPAGRDLADNNCQEIVNCRAGRLLASQLLLESAYQAGREPVVNLSPAARDLTDSNCQKIVNYQEGQHPADWNPASNPPVENVYPAAQNPVVKLSRADWNPASKPPVGNVCPEGLSLASQLLLESAYPEGQEPVVKLSPAVRGLADNNCRMIVNCQADRHPADQERMVNLSPVARHLADSNYQKIANYPEGLSLASQLLLESAYPAVRDLADNNCRMIVNCQADQHPAVREPASKLLVGNVCPEGRSLVSQRLLESPYPEARDLLVNNYRVIVNYQEGRDAIQDPINLAFRATAKERHIFDGLHKVTFVSFTAFDAKNRRTEAVIELGGQKMRVMKGTVRTVAQACRLEPPAITALESRVSESVMKGYRTLALARGPEKGAPALVRFVTLLDPPQPYAKQLIQIGGMSMDFFGRYRTNRQEKTRYF